MRTVLLVLMLLPSAALAQGEPVLRDLQHARGFAMGGAFRGLGLDAQAVDGNPAAMSAFQRYQLELSGAWDIGNKYAFGNLSVLDSKTQRVAVGVSYHLVSFGIGEYRRTAHLSTVAFGLPLLGDWLHLGLSTRHLVMTGAAQANAITADAGLLFKLGPGLHLSASGHNLLDIHHPEMSRYYVFSGGWAAGLAALGVDVRLDMKTPPAPQLVYSVGGEYILGEGLPIRAGYAYDTLVRRHYVSAGIGIIAEGGGLDLGYRQEIGGLGRMLALTFRLQP